ncbi:MAG: hypothetical protein ACOYJ2_02205 [Rickettsiales bacterium]
MNRTWVERAADAQRPFQATYPHIRMLDADCLVIDIQGNVNTFDYETFRRPLLVLNRDELNENFIRSLLNEGTYRRMFADVERLENLYSYEYNKRRDRLAPSKMGLNKFLSHFFVTNADGNTVYDDDYTKAYKAAENDTERAHLLTTLYDDSIKKLEPDPAAIICKRAQEYVDSHPSDIGQMTDNFARRRRLSHAISVMDPDVLEILNDTGCNIFTARDGATFGQPTTLGFTRQDAGIIFVNSQSITDTETLYEEVIHYVDAVFGFSALRDWKSAVKSDLDNPNQGGLARHFLREAASLVIRGKASLFDKRNYNPKDIPMEMLADMHYVEHKFDLIEEQWRSNSNPSSQLKSVLNYLDQYRGEDHPTILSELFSKTWPLYLEFKALTHERGAALREARLEQKQDTAAEWTLRALGGDKQDVTERN